MFDIGWSEMAVIALLTLIVIGPKELPRVLRTVGQWVRKAQSLAREFQRGLDDMAREADLEDAKKLVDAGRSIANPKKMIMDNLDPTGSVQDEANELQTAITAKAPDGEAAGKSAAKTGGPNDQPSAQDGTPDAAGSANDESVKAAIVKHPVNIAPPHSITSPLEAKAKSKPKPKTKPRPKTKSAPKPAPKPKAAPKAKPAPKPAGSDGSQKTA